MVALPIKWYGNLQPRRRVNLAYKVYFPSLGTQPKESTVLFIFFDQAFQINESKLWVHITLYNCWSIGLYNYLGLGRAVFPREAGPIDVAS